MCNWLRLVLAFIFATAWAYLACVVYTVLGRPALIGIDIRIQTAFYLGAFGLFLYVFYNPNIWVLNQLLGGLYGILSMGSFIGYPQRWAVYWRNDSEEGCGAGQIGMAFWDLVLAVAFLSLI